MANGPTTTLAMSPPGQNATPGADDAPRRRIDLIGVGFDVVDLKKTLDLLIRMAKTDEPQYVVTANVDHLVRLRRCPEIKHIYEEADLVVADGMPLIWLSRMLRTPLPERVAGSDLFPELCAKAASEHLSVFLLGGAPGVAQQAAEVLRVRHPDLCLAGTYCPDYGFEDDPQQAAHAVRAVADAHPDILFVGLGSPKQERWIARHRAECGAKLSIGVGISFSFLTGDVVRAPRWMQRAGFEWLHRLFQEPGRLWKRYLVQDALFVPLAIRQVVQHALGRRR